jgi:PIN domain nuclease of toxin-antitoxin system
MKLLLDTHTFLWAVWEPERLSELAQAKFLDIENELLLSAASYWEICIKHSVGKLILAQGWQEILDREIAANGIQWLSIEKEHCQAILTLPQIHGDPFDRLLVAQALHEGLSIVTRDVNIAEYEVETIW